MKKAMMLLIGMILVFSLAGFAAAQEKAKPAEPAKPAEAAKPAEPKKEAPKPVVYRMGGTITALDTDAGKVTIRQDTVKKQKKATFNVARKAEPFLQGLKVGDAVNIWVSGKTITQIIKVF
jgi:Cu/Ag efflux protein CusF